MMMIGDGLKPPASAAGKAVVVVDGRLVENLHVQEAERDLELAERIGRRGR